MALKVSKVEYKGIVPRKRGNERVRTSKLSSKGVKVSGELRTAIIFLNNALYIDDTIEQVNVPYIEKPLVISDIFEGMKIDSNYKFIFASNEVSRYEGLTSTLLSIIVKIESTRYRLTNTKGVYSFVQLFTRIDICDNEFLIVLNPLFSVVNYEGKLVLMRRNKKNSRYSIRLENILREYKSGRIEMRFPTLVNKLDAPLTYAKKFGLFDGRLLNEAVETINSNGNGVYIKDYGYSENDSVWFNIEVQ